MDLFLTEAAGTIKIVLVALSDFFKTVVDSPNISYSNCMPLSFRINAAEHLNPSAQLLSYRPQLSV